MMDQPARASATLADAVIETLKSSGVQRLFGIPGGGSSLALIEAAGRASLDFVLTRTETAGAIMSAVTGEMTGTPGVMLTGIGPGATSAVNGIAYASLEKSPVVLLTDGPSSTPHQALDHNALYAPITKMQGRLSAQHGAQQIAKAIETALTPPWGPVQFDLTSGDATTLIQGFAPMPLNTKASVAPTTTMEKAAELLSRARRPIILAGLEARHGGAPGALRKMTDVLACPVLLGFKAGGVLSSSHPGYAGLFTGAIAESELIRSADLIVLFGFDAIEIIPGKWPYDAPVLDLCRAEATALPVEPACKVTGDLAKISGVLLASLEKSDWTSAEISDAKKSIAEKFSLHGRDETAQKVTELAAELAPEGARLTVDAGAHMFATLACWPAEEAFGILKSDGLSTMGYALPAAIASSLQEPERHVVAVTGDGGLMMCLSELTTAAVHGCNITVVVINDAALSLIDIKQQRQQYKPRGVRYPSVDFAGCAAALGCRSWRVENGAHLPSTLKVAFSARGPTLVDIICNPDGYGDQLVRIRG
jgi:acetolactate synthase-1/2/3 large subunit